MAEVKIIDASKIIGVYPISNTGAVLVYSIDYGEDRVLAGINDQTPEWCDLVDEYLERTGEQELGFHLGSFFVPFCEVQRFYGGS